LLEVKGATEQLRLTEANGTDKTSFTSASGNLTIAPSGGTVNVTGILKASTDIYTSAFTDISSSCVVTGFCSTPTKCIYAKKIGKTIFIHFYVYGVDSNTTGLRIELPSAYASVYTYSNHIIFPVRNEVTGNTQGGAIITNGSGGPGYYIDISASFGGSNDWTASGNKIASGILIYEGA
jgi:hypothetical protein